MPDGFSHQQAAISCEQDAFFLLYGFRHSQIVVIILIQTIETQHAQMSCQSTEVTVEQKPGLNGEAVFDGIHFNFIPILCYSRQCLILTIDLDFSHFWMWHTQRFHQMFDGLSPLKVGGYLLVFLFPSQEIV